jgi:hypothetical protein
MKGEVCPTNTGIGGGGRGAGRSSADADILKLQGEMRRTHRFDAHLIHIPKRAGARSTGIATTAASTCGGSDCGSSFRGRGKHRELGLQLLSVALGTRSFVLAKNQGFKLVIAFLADVLQNRHDRPLLRSSLTSIIVCGQPGCCPSYLPIRINLCPMRNSLSRLFEHGAALAADIGKHWLHFS